MLAEEEKHAINAEMAHYPDTRAAIIEALKIVQSHRGWISDEALRDIAEHLHMTPAEIDSVATFFNLLFRRPVGRHIILMCNSVSCWIMGYEKLRYHMQAQLGADFGLTTTDGRYTLLPVPCLGACDHAPALMVDDDLHEDVTTESIGAILDRYR